MNIENEPLAQTESVIEIHSQPFATIFRYGIGNVLLLVYKWSMRCANMRLCVWVEQ